MLMELIGESEKGGFASEGDLRAALYENHQLMSLRDQRGRCVLSEFDWNCESAVVLPGEHAAAFVAR